MKMLKRAHQEYKTPLVKKPFSRERHFKRRNKRLVGRTVLIVAIALFVGRSLAYAWPWSTDMSKQPSIKPQRAPRVPPPNSIPIQGKETAMDRVEAGKKLQNPLKPTPASLENGKLLFNIYCVPCHGSGGKGDGLVSKKFTPPSNLTSEESRNRPDGYLFATIRAGGSSMPSQADGLSPQETWDIVNYLRSLQRK
jgi:mono/diheme cytochrome c family protein